ncbi:MAG: DUF3352 domain-containing protein [Cytophagales bacterium]|nr:DUF3352 domain-containing protein [Bernardetiaceae bacterium]MDW8205441.1 DUF3352 domain-containing protein [Cytophagales bacterium]
MRKVVVLLILIACLLYVGWYYIGQRIGNLPAISLVPADAVFIIQTDEPIASWREISRSNIWHHLRKQPYFAALTQGANELDSIIEKNNELFKLLGSRQVSVSAHVYKPMDYDFLFVVDLESAARLTFLQEYLVGLPFPGFNLAKREFEGTAIYEFRNRKSGALIAVAFVENLLLCSFQGKLVENALLQRQSPQLLQNQKFVQVNSKTSDSGLFKLFVNYAYLDDYFRCYMPSNDFLDGISKELAFTGSNIYIQNDDWLQLSGLTNLPDSIHSYYRALLQAGQGRMSVHELLPQQTANYLTLTCKDFAVFYQSFEQKYKENAAAWSDYQRNVQQIERFLKLNFRESFIDWIGEEVAIAQLLPESGRSEKDYAVFIKAKDESIGREKLDLVGEQIRKRTPLKLIETEYKGYPIKYLTVKFFFRLFLEKLFKKLERPYFTYIEDYVVFSNHPQTLKNIIDNYQAGRTLSALPGFNELIDQCSRAGNIFIYAQMPVLFPTMRSMVSPATWATMNANQAYINCFEHIGLQLIGDEETFDTRLWVRFNPQATSPSFVAISHTVNTDSLEEQTESGSADVIINDLHAKVQVEYYSNGVKKREIEIRDGFKHGDYREYHPNGRIKVRGRYRNDKADGIWRYYDTDGSEIVKKRFENGIEMQQ